MKNWDKADSFVTHRNSISNLESIKTNGLAVFLKQQNKRIQILEELIENYDDGKSKSFYCLSATLLPIEELKKAIVGIKGQNESINDKKIMAKAIKNEFSQIAERNNIELIYRKKA
jgi:hypothetical protein